MLTLNDVARHPEKYVTQIVSDNGNTIRFRPLVHVDEPALANFFRELSSETRRFYSFSADPEQHAGELCGAINRYDKLRFVAETNQDPARLISLLEISFAIVPADKRRYANQGIMLDESQDCRYGACVSDHFQNQGLGSLLLKQLQTVARMFGKRRMILWGGVFCDNHRAIAYYKKNGFIQVGEFKNGDGACCLDMICDIDADTGV